MAMNNVCLMGRITRDLELRQAGSKKDPVPVLSFTVAVDHDYVVKGEERGCEFINCVAWRNNAEFIEKYFRKGAMIGINGHLQCRTYEDENEKMHYITEVVVDHAYFTGEKKEDKPTKTKSKKSKRYDDDEDD